MTLTIIRKWFTKNSTIGEFFVDGEFLCYVLEDCVRDLVDKNKDGDFDDAGEGKIYGETAIPYGEYEVVLSRSPKFKKILPEILNVVGYSGVRIHSGNSKKDTYGCPLLGLTKGKDFVGKSRDAMKLLMPKFKGVDKIKLIIEKEATEPFPQMCV